MEDCEKVCVIHVISKIFPKMFHAIAVLIEVTALKTACFCYLLGVILQIFQLPFKFNRSRLASITTIYAMCKISW